MKIEIHGHASMKADVRTVGDLRELVKWLDKYKVQSEREIEFDRDVWLTLADTSTGSVAEFIECGDHIPPDRAFDVVINTHTHPDASVPQGTPKYDWMNIDKYGTVWDGLPE